MPICQTCQGEYVSQDCLCPYCKQPLGERSVNLCHHCGAETGGRRLCPRCKCDVSAWEQESFSLLRFIFRWGALGTLPGFVALLLWILFWSPKGETLHHPLFALGSFFASQLLVILLYLKRLFWRERQWSAQIYNMKSRPLVFIIAGTFVGGMVFAVIAFALQYSWGRLETIEFWKKLIFAAFYVPTFLFLTATLTLLAIQDYLHDLEQRVPQPIFANTDCLLGVVLETACKILHTPGGENTTQDMGRNAAVPESCEVLEIARNLEDGGIHVLFRERDSVSGASQLTSREARWRGRLWSVDADRWGRIMDINPGWTDLDKKH